MTPTFAILIALAVLCLGALIRWTFVASRSDTPRRRVFQVTWFWVSAFMACIFVALRLLPTEVEVPTQAQWLSFVLDTAIVVGIGALAAWSITRSVFSMRNPKRRR